MDLIEQIVLNTRSEVYGFDWGYANSKKGVRKTQIGMIFDSGVRNFQKVENRWCRVNFMFEDLIEEILLNKNSKVYGFDWTHCIDLKHVKIN